MVLLVLTFQYFIDEFWSKKGDFFAIWFCFQENSPYYCALIKRLYLHQAMMKQILLPVLFLFAALNASASFLVLEGNYQGKNLYVQNPFATGGPGFCTIKVMVNDNVTTDEWNSSAFEIDLSLHKLNVGDPVTIKIEHKEGCTPKVLNPEVLKPKSTFEVVDMQVTPAGKLTWKTKGENGKLPYVIEQKIWNKWIPVGEVNGEGTAGEHNYDFQLTPHSGENTVRVKQVDYTNKPRYSQPKTFADPSVKEVDFIPKRVKNSPIKFVETGTEKGVKTRYEIYDSYGNIVKKGYADQVDVSTLKSGAYYINFDNKDSQFIKN